MFTLTILYAADPLRSAAFYAALLGCEPRETSSTFAMLPLGPTTNLGLWARHTVEPTATIGGGGTELAMMTEDVDAVHAEWVGRGLTIAQNPTDMDFGRTFVALDLDGHRLRVLRPS